MVHNYLSIGSLYKIGYLGALQHRLGEVADPRGWEVRTNTLPGADPGFPVGGDANPLRGRQHMILPSFAKNCIGIENILGRGGRPLDLATAFGPISIIFMPNNWLAHPPVGLAPNNLEFWIHHWRVIGYVHFSLGGEYAYLAEKSWQRNTFSLVM